MTLLAIETATAACSVALIEDGRVIAADHALVGRGHAERLLPMIAALPGGGRADAIRVDCGPGSFTGIRVGLAAARALSFGWGVPVTGYSSLALIAARWFADHDGDAVTVVIEGGHGEVFVQRYGRGVQMPVTALRSVPSADAAAVLAGQVLTGNAAPRFGDGVPGPDPDARDVILLGDAALPPVPLYGRGADAQPLA